MTDMTAPERIWLNTAGCYDEAHGHADEMGVTWCEHPQDDDDQEYIRADLGSFYQEKDIDAMQDRIEALEAENARLREALADIARQKKTTELNTKYDVECAAFEDGYDMCIATARAALEGGEARIGRKREDEA